MKTAVMKTLKQFLMVSAFVVLASVAAFAQKNDDQKKNPKDNPPKIVVPEGGKNRPKDNDDKPRERRDNDRRKPEE